tara:strand:- start:6 stop:941 length:936 start_codon:yes stop_codon:yes gene_type:complete
MDIVPATKKQKIVHHSLTSVAIPGKTELFRVTISAPSSFKNLCDILGSVLSELPIVIVCKDDFHGIKVHSMNDRQIAFIKLRYACPVQSKEEEVRCCLSIKDFNLMLKEIPNTSVIHLVQYRHTNKKGEIQDDDELTILVDDERAAKKEYRCKTLQMLEDNYTSLEDVESENVIEFDLSTFKGDVKLSKAAKATSLDFTLYNSIQTDDTRTLISVAWKGDNLSSNTMHMSQNKVATSIDNQKVNLEKWKRHYERSFDTEMINSFLKNMDRESKIIVCLTEEMMIMDYNLGVENSHIRFYLAPKVEDDEEEA